MFGYWLLIGVPIVLSFMDLPKKKLNNSLFMLGVFYVLFVGLRYEVGSDRWAYADMYDMHAKSSFKEVLEGAEPAYGIMNWLIGQFDGSIYWINFIVAIIFISGLVRFAKTTPLPFLALIAVTPYLIIVIGMSATRQCVAIGLVFHLMASWRQGLVYKVSLSSLATLFHSSGIVSFIFVMQILKMRPWVRLLFYGLGAAVLYPILTQTDAALKYQKTYLEDDLLSSGALMHASLNVVPAVIYLVFRRQWLARFGASELLPLLAALSILSVFGVSVSSTGVDRLALYLTPIQMIVYGSLPFLFGYQYKTQLTVGIIVIQMLIMFFWLSYANTAEPFLPYQNLMTDALLNYS